MEWLKDLILGAADNPALTTAHAVVVLGLVASLGLAVGRIPIFGVRLGVAGVLFVGLVFGHYRIGIDHTILEFARDFGLILFVYTIGLQIGPGFGASLKKQGLPLNIMAALIVILGVVLTVAIGHFALPKSEFAAMVGVFCGATTNTPSLAAAQQAIGTNVAAAKLPALGYAVAYPFGVVGIILSMFLIRWIFRVDPQKEAEELSRADGDAKKLEAVSVEVANGKFGGLTLDELLEESNRKVVVSRVRHGATTHIASGDEVIEDGDLLLAVGPPNEVEEFSRMVGHVSAVDLKKQTSQIASRNMLVTQRAVIGKSIPELRLMERLNVTATRISRGDIEMPVTDDVKLMFGDRVMIVGIPAALVDAAKEFGDSVEMRDHPMLIPMFAGMVLGLILGMLPIPLPGFPVPVKLGLAGGPLIAAIALGRIGKIGPLVWYMPRGANLTVRKIGIVLFLACVGVKAGDQFVQTLVHGHGLQWMAYGAVITLVPLLLVGLGARIFGKLNYMPLCGLLAGSMTDPPALAFAGSITNSEAPSVAYASVYPLVMLLRILAAQLMILFFR